MRRRALTRRHNTDADDGLASLIEDRPVVSYHVPRLARVGFEERRTALGRARD
jgi:hypothetical protein